MLRFVAQKNTIACKKGQQFVIEGAPINGLFFLFKGKAKVIKTGIYGKEQILRFVKEGEIIGHRGFGTKEKYSVGALAIEDSILCNFSSDVLKDIILKTPTLSYDFMLFYAEELNTSEAKVKKLAQMTVREKVIDTLFYIQRKFGNNLKGFISVKLSRKEIADFAGTTDEQVIRTISALKKEKLLTTLGKQIKINDLALLKKEISEHNFFLDS
jgi:CRP-like cAMP-binding protein